MDIVSFPQPSLRLQDFPGAWFHYDKRFSVESPYDLVSRKH